ncbi:hypothetical protein GALMADRAFT_155822 [Galerina marginata CBS 339.88]|uniref:Protein kinase domain-containing protein n=1 Tax=Galerina marginata (strain CBS 339.88) TaxID=685588 RepID=A0A067T205_GALM3|nr:hypothetical protein GALMADRAFT_155822 [Galerina marginata CBS 339.88]
MANDFLPDFVIELEHNEPPQSMKQALLIEVLPNGQPSELGSSDVKTLDQYMQHHTLERALFRSKLPQTASEREKEVERTKALNDPRTRWRFLFLIWPRDPNGKRLTDSNSRLGKMAGGGRELIWGATLLDLYYVYRDPNFKELLTIVSGSKMYNWCKAHGEDYAGAKDAMQRAADEEEPHIVPVYSIKELIKNHERWTATVFPVSWTTGKGGKGKEKEGQTKKNIWELPKPWPPKSPFHAYPKPWPFPPFTRDWLVDRIRFINHIPNLQEYIPQHLLPEKLVVHDPWKLLYAVESRKDNYTPWEEKEDITHIYKLKPSSKNTARRREDQKAQKEYLAKSKAVREAFLANPHSSQVIPDGSLYLPRLAEGGGEGGMPIIEIGPAKPPVFIVFPLRPAPVPAKKAHLFLSPNETLGTGHHSFVYRAEFEVPRSLVVEDDICLSCVYGDAERILLEEDGPNGERRDPKWDELSGEYTLEVRGLNAGGTKVGEHMYQLRPDTQHLEAVYKGPFRAIETTVGYQNIERKPYKYCSHSSNPAVHPLTAKTLVAAKLSIQHDKHLEREAENYQTFPRDFFEHYTGYNIVKPLTYPTPVSALVPQFYGYYVLDESDTRNAKGKSRYLSPIMLIEECGQAIVPEELTLDDQDECASLVYRLHLAGWVHNSLFRRNIVRQPGPLSAHPNMRALNAYHGRGGLGKDWSFRMIDFGRTTHVSQTKGEEWEEYRKDEDKTAYEWIIGNRTLDH